MAKIFEKDAYRKEIETKIKKIDYENKTIELDLNFIDFTLPLRQQAQLFQEKKLLYFPINRHLTTSGHEVIAKEITSFLFNLRNKRIKHP